MEQPVQFVQIRREIQSSFLSNIYQFRQDRPCRWLQKAAFWILGKLSCFAIQHQTVSAYDVVDTHKLVDSLWKQQQATFEFYHHIKASCLLVGPQEFNELMSLDVTHPLSINTQYMWADVVHDRWGMPSPPHVTRNQMRVTVIPWMKGFLVLPKDAKLFE